MFFQRLLNRRKRPSHCDHRSVVAFETHDVVNRLLLMAVMSARHLNRPGIPGHQGRYRKRSGLGINTLLDSKNV